jgi:hypothetical protein
MDREGPFGVDTGVVIDGGVSDILVIKLKAFAY